MLMGFPLEHHYRWLFVFSRNWMLFVECSAQKGWFKSSRESSFGGLFNVTVNTRDCSISQRNESTPTPYINPINCHWCECQWLGIERGCLLRLFTFQYFCLHSISAVRFVCSLHYTLTNRLIHGIATAWRWKWQKKWANCEMKSDYNELSKHERKLINQFIACLHIFLTNAGKWITMRRGRMPLNQWDLRAYTANSGTGW